MSRILTTTVRKLVQTVLFVRQSSFGDASSASSSSGAVGMPIQYKEGEDYVTSSATTMISVALAEWHERNMDGDTSWKLQMEAKRTTCVVNVIDLMHFVATPEQMEVFDDPEPAINDPKWQDWHKALITACREIEYG